MWTAWSSHRVRMPRIRVWVSASSSAQFPWPTTPKKNSQPAASRNFAMATDGDMLGMGSSWPPRRAARTPVPAARALEGVVGVITGEDVARHTRPFAVGVTAPVRYYCAATDKARFVGEPVAVVVARSRYLAEDAAEAVVVRYEPLPAVVDVERALDPDAPVLHEGVGGNLAGHRRLVYGDPDRAFAQAEIVIRERFRYP